MKRFLYLLVMALMLALLPQKIFAQGLFGLPQGYSRNGHGLYTAIGFLHLRDLIENDRRYLFSQQIIYSEAGYGISHGIELYGRIGWADGVLSGPIGPANYHVSSTDLRADDRLVGTIGFRWSQPITSLLRWGVFAQGSYYINDGADEVSGLRSDGKATGHEIRIKNQWLINGGLSLQTDLPGGIKCYAGPYLHYEEGKMVSLAPIPGQKERIRSSYALGAFGGIKLPLVKRFSLTCEGWYGERFSLGTMITYTY